ncbi:MAG: hypothetical protein ACTH0E_00630 [Candidatus Microbacterium stercoravium]|uniref:Uncharacterized protein n=1 Tax=Candidatus Microbacterium stercoravium TaxID=2838697 RepID=A0A9D2H5U2_9MICO|nr:hypothetical protein [Candidatus Microbacterium stercoravium]
MNTTVPTHPPRTPVQALSGRTPRTALSDRIAMRIGLALLLWGTRPVKNVGPNVSGHGVQSRTDARREIDRTLAAHGHPFSPFAR